MGNKNVVIHDESDDEIEAILEDISTPTTLDASKAIETLRQYFINHYSTDEQLMDQLDSIQDKAYILSIKNLKQSKITDYFKQ